MLSRPLPRLAVLTLTAFTTRSYNATGTELSIQANFVLAANLEQQFVVALLTPMSQLVESPYADPSIVDNPLKLPARFSTTEAVIKTVISKPVAASLVQQDIGALKHGVENYGSITAVAPPELAGGSILASGAEQTAPVPYTFKTTFAMIGR
jgi:hypothetical protein